jgi:Protein of unknown function (DUF4232)
MRTTILAAAVLALGAGGSALATPATDTPCKGGALRGSFSAVPGSAGAGNIVYALRLRNVSQATCTLTGLPQVRLVDKRHKPLPTNVTAAHPGQLTAVLVRLAPGAWASASARFSPDVPGVGEGSTRQCEPTAFALRVSAPGHGMALVPARPHTPVCEHGGMSFSAYVQGRRPPNT